MGKNFRKASLAAIGAAVLLAVASAPPASAQCNDLVIRAFQGNYEQSFRGGDEIVLLPNRDGHIRMYWRSGGEDPYTLTADFGNPSQFGMRGEDPRRVVRVIRMNPQDPGARSRAKVTFTTGQPGRTTIGYHIVTAPRKDVYNRIPAQCRKGILTIRVQPGGGYQGQGPGQGPGYGAPPASRPPSNVPWIAGLWETNFGRVELTQNGNQIQGTYPQNNGRIRGILRGNVMTGTWTQDPTHRPPRDAGTVEFVFNRDGTLWNGNWRFGNSGPWEGAWNGQKVR